MLLKHFEWNNRVCGPRASWYDAFGQNAVWVNSVQLGTGIFLGRGSGVTRWHHTFIVTGKSEQQQEIFHMSVCVCVRVRPFLLLCRGNCKIFSAPSTLSRGSIAAKCFWSNKKSFKQEVNCEHVHWPAQTTEKRFLFEQEMMRTSKSRGESEIGRGWCSKQALCRRDHPCCFLVWRRIHGRSSALPSSCLHKSTQEW